MHEGKEHSRLHGVWKIGPVGGCSLLSLNYLWDSSDSVSVFDGIVFVEVRTDKYM